MKYYGINGTPYNLMQSYLDNRYQRTVIKDKNLNYLHHGKLLDTEFHKAQYWVLDYFSFILMIFL